MYFRNIIEASFVKGTTVREVIVNLRINLNLGTVLKSSDEPKVEVVKTEWPEQKENKRTRKQKTVTSKKSDTVCHFCGKSYQRPSGLKVHIATFHNKEKDFPCNHCDKRFGRLDTLNKHKRVHSQEQNYVCDFCSRPFSQSSNLIKHRLVCDQNVQLSEVTEKCEKKEFKCLI